MDEVGYIWMNGKMIPFKDAKVHILTHALHYASLVFEGIRCYNTPDGSAIFRLPEHVDRLFRSAKAYSMKIPFSKDQITEAIIDTVKTSKLKEAYIRPIVYYGYGHMGLTPTKTDIDVAIACWEWSMGESKAGKFSGAKCKVSSWIKIDSRFQPIQAKAAANYGNAAFARLDAINHGYDEAIMLNAHGNVAEASVENIFLIKNKVISTPPLSAGGLDGITRDSVISIIKKRGGDIREREINRDELYDADEIFMTGTAAEIKSVTQVDDITIGNGEMGSNTLQLQRLFNDVVMGKNKDFRPWLRFI